MKVARVPTVTASVLTDSCSATAAREGSRDQIGARADRVVRRVRAIEGNTLLFSSGHFLRVFATRWLGLEPGAGRYFLLGTTSLSVVGCEHDRSEPAIRLWDEMPREQRISPASAGGYQEKARR
jgi:broad specificity phosphatase PhoE